MLLARRHVLTQDLIDAGLPALAFVPVGIQYVGIKPQCLVPALTPVAYSPQFFLTRGSFDAPLYQGDVRAFENTSSETVRHLIEAGLATSPLGNFVEVWDVQRSQEAPFQGNFIVAATIYIVVYGAVAGIIENMMDQIQNDFAAFRSFGNVPKDAVYTNLPEANVTNLHIGYQLMHSGSVHF